MDNYFEIAVIGLHLRPLTYRSDLDVEVGELVFVNVKNIKRLGLIIAKTDIAPNIKNVKYLQKCQSGFKINEHMLALAHWMSKYYLTPISEVISLMLPNEVAKNCSTADNKLLIT